MDRRKFVESMALSAVALVGASAVATAAPPPRFPHIRHAIKALEAAKIEMQAAPDDFGGHKADALEAVNHALEQLNRAMQFVRRR